MISRTIPDTYKGYGDVRPTMNQTKSHTAQVGDLLDEDPIIDSLRKKGRTPIRYEELSQIIRASGLADGMRISFHHHLRLGDRVLQMVLEELMKMGFKDLTLCLSSVMGEACKAVLQAVETGVISMIETTGMKPPLSTAVQQATLGIPVVIRSHGGRARALMQEDISIQVAFIAASACDRRGNITGAVGPNRFGSIGYAIPDALRSEYVVVITDHEEESIPVSIPYQAIDGLLRVPSIGAKEGLSGGSIRRTKRPVEKLIARRAAEVIIASDLVRAEFSFQVGSGGISLEVSQILAEYLKKRDIKCSFISGGITEPLVKMHEEGLVERLYDVQSFDDAAAVSLSENKEHIEMSSSLYADPTNESCLAHRLDIMVLSATEVDLDFNVNSFTGTDGRILGALGGAPDTAAGARLTVVVLPSFRGRIPSICSSVRTVCTPGGTVDVVVTERGIAVNPLREDILSCLKTAGIPTLTMGELLEKVLGITGKPMSIARHAQLQGIVEYRDGTVIDTF